MKNKWELLCTDKIIRILIGDNADCQTEEYRLGLPYLRGQDICSLATRFGFPIVYKEDDLGCKSRCEMFKAFLLNMIKREMVSNVLAYMFSMTQFDYLTELCDRDSIQAASRTGKRLSLRPDGVRKTSGFADSLTSTTARSAVIYTISASLPSAWSGAGQPMSQCRRSRRKIEIWKGR